MPGTISRCNRRGSHGEADEEREGEGRASDPEREDAEEGEENEALLMRTLEVDTFDGSVTVPAWLYRMPDEWWESYFEKCGEMAVSPVWGNA